MSYLVVVLVPRQVLKILQSHTRCVPELGLVADMHVRQMIIAAIVSSLCCIGISSGEHLPAALQVTSRREPQVVLRNVL